MLKILSMFVLLTQILNICFSSNEIQTSLILENNIPQMAFLPLNNQKIDSFLIYPSSTIFQEYVLPFVSSKDAIKIFLHFQTLNPNLQFESFLPPVRFITRNPILPVQEVEFLYCFDKEYYPFFEPIWFSKKNNFPKIVSGISENSVCALFSGDKICRLNVISISSGQELLALNYGQIHEFFVAFKKKDGKLETLAYGPIFEMEMDFPEYLQCIWDAYNLKGCKKYCVKMFYFLQILWVLKYPKYFFFVCNGFNRILNKLHRMGTNWLTFCPCVILGPVTFVLTFHLVALPFHIIAAPFYIYTKNCLLITYLPEYIFGIYVFFFPQLLQSWRASPQRIMEHMTQNFKIQYDKEENNMWAVPFFIQKKKFPSYLPFSFLVFCCVYLVGYVLSLPLLAFCPLIDGEN